MFQLGFRTNHSTETAPLKVLSEYQNKQQQAFWSSAAFDTVDHLIILDRWIERVGLPGIAFNWLTSYLCGKDFFL